MQASNDLFLSYRWADAQSVEPLLGALRARGVRVWRDAREVEDFSSIQQAVSTGLAGARALLAWYSTRYNGSRACQWEMTAAYCAAQAEGDPRRRILVLNPEPGNAHVHLPELFDQLQLSAQGLLGDANAVDALADRIQSALEDRVPTTPLGELRALTPPRWLPAMGTGSTRFVGRLPQMWELHGKLQAGQAAMLTGTGGKPGVALVRGAGGIGKSLMAEEYALRFGAAYPGGVFWIRAYGHPDGGTVLTPEQRANLRNAQILDLAIGLGLDTSRLNAAQVRAVLAQHLEHAAQPFLWVIDDLPSDLGAELLGDWLAPHPLGRTLFTSRTKRFTHVPTLDLPQLDPLDARGLLTRGSHLDEEDVRTADTICAVLGHHALAVDVSAALVARRGLSGTLQALERTDRDVLELAAQFEEALPNGHQRHIAATFLASVSQLDEEGRDLLCLAAVLAAAPIPKPLLVRSIAAAADLDDDEARDRTELAMDHLLSSSLADDAGRGTIAVHTLVARTIRFAEGAAGSLSKWRAHAIRVVAEEMSQAWDGRMHARLLPWVDHARELCSSSADEPEAIDLMGWVARFDLECGAYALARSGYETELRARKRLMGEEHPHTLRAMGNLASTMRRQGDLEEARLLQEAALEISKRVLGEEDLDTLWQLGNLAATLTEQGDLVGARHMQEEVLEAHRRRLGESRPETLWSMSNLAVTLVEQGELTDARQLQEVVLKFQKQELGEHHPDTLRSMGNLARTMKSQGDLTGARELLEPALQVSRGMLGEEHPDTLRVMGSLANSLRDLGDLAGARRLQEWALDFQSRLFGKDHSETLTSMGDLAITLADQGELNGARQLQTEVLEARRKRLGEVHPDTLKSMGNLASTLRQQGDLHGARQLQEGVLATLRTMLGEEHPATLWAMNNLATTLRSLGDLPGSRLLQEAALQTSKHLLGEEHPDTLRAKGSLASTMRLMGDPHGAKKLQEEVMAAHVLRLGKEHPDTLRSMNNLAVTLVDLGDSLRARLLQEETLEARTRLLGEFHADTLRSMSNLASILWAQGEAVEARRLQARCVAGRTRTLGPEHPDTKQATQAWRQMGGKDLSEDPTAPK